MASGAHPSGVVTRPGRQAPPGHAARGRWAIVRSHAGASGPAARRGRMANLSGGVSRSASPSTPASTRSPESTSNAGASQAVNPRSRSGRPAAMAAMTAGSGRPSGSRSAMTPSRPESRRGRLVRVPTVRPYGLLETWSTCAPVCHSPAGSGNRRSNGLLPGPSRSGSALSVVSTLASR
jgi:hypothetical protein